MCSTQEVKAEHSRFATAAEGSAPVVVEPLVGDVKGIGGVIEMLRGGRGRGLLGPLRCQVRLFQGPAHPSHRWATEVHVYYIDYIYIK